MVEKKPPLDMTALARDLRAGHRAALARAITLVESRRSDHQALARELVQQLLPDTGKAVRVGITGSPGVGWELKAKAGKKKVVLELGGNAAVVVDKDADLEHALARIIFGGYYQSGQSCIHVQRVIIHTDIYDQFREMLAAKVKTLKSGDPKNRDTFIGPMISAKEAQRLKGWIDAAVAGGAKLLAGGGCEGNMLEATLLEGCSRDMDVYTEEAFGPVVILSKFTDWDAALDEVNDS